jgi:acyl-coenzyme A synthetase/AMP-(fatty) acid ligase
MTLINLLVQARIRAEGVKAEKRLRADTANPKETQLRVLRRILSTHATTQFGKLRGFDQIKTVEQYRSQVPIHEYEDLRSWIERQDTTSKPIITGIPPLMYATTSGTTGKPKFIPVLESTLKSQKAIQNLFTYHMLLDHPRVFGGSILGIVSPADG